MIHTASIARTNNQVVSEPTAYLVLPDDGCVSSKHDKHENSIRDARTPQPGEIVFNTMTYRKTGILSAQCHK